MRARERGNYVIIEDLSFVDPFKFLIFAPDLCPWTAFPNKPKR